MTTLTDALCELRQDGQGATPQAEGLARSIRQKLGELNGLVQTAVANAEKYGLQQPAHTVAGRLEQARRWLANPSADDRGLGQQAIALIVEEGRKVFFIIIIFYYIILYYYILLHYYVIIILIILLFVITFVILFIPLGWKLSHVVFCNVS